MKILKYYYYRIYKYFEKGDAVPFFSTFLVIIVFLYFNLITLLEFIGILIGFSFKLLVIGGVWKFWPIIFILPIFGLFYYCLKSRGNHESIIKEFEGESRKQFILSSLIAILYFIISIGLFVGSLWLREKVRGY